MTVSVHALSGRLTWASAEGHSAPFLFNAYGRRSCRRVQGNISAHRRGHENGLLELDTVIHETQHYLGEVRLLLQKNLIGGSAESRGQGECPLIAVRGGERDIDLAPQDSGNVVHVGRLALPSLGRKESAAEKNRRGEDQEHHAGENHHLQRRLAPCIAPQTGGSRTAWPKKRRHGLRGWCSWP